jgi:hypothetical protein
MRHLPILAALLAAGFTASAAGTVTLETQVIPGQATASSQSKDQAAGHLIDNSGLDATLRHDRHGAAYTMWHTAGKSAPNAPATGIPAAAAWVRFDFATPQPINQLLVWNHNQANLSQRGFRKTRVYGTVDGTTWSPIAEPLELAKGGDTAQAIAIAAPQPLKAVIIAADSNWGDDYYGLSEVKFISRRTVDANAIPAPKAIAIADFPFECDAQGRPHRQVELSFGDTPLYEAAEAVVTCDGAKAATKLDFSARGRHHIVLPLPAGKADTRKAAAKVDVILSSTNPEHPWKLTAAGAIEPSKVCPDLKEIIVVIKTHFDIGYTHRVKEIVHHYRTGMIDKAMDIMDQSKNLPPEQQFAWTGPGWVMSKVLEDWEGQTPARRQRLDDYVKAGKFQFHALPFTLESDACEAEEMARGFLFSSNLCRNYGRPLPRSGKMTDVPSHGGALATVLANGGVQFMHIGCNWPSGAVKTPGLFWWEAPDGSRVLTFYSNSYGTCVPSFMPHWYSAGDHFISDNFGPTDDWPYAVWPAILVTPDNSGPPQAEQVKTLFADVAKRFPGVKVRVGTMDDFADALLATKPELPVIKGEMPDTWIHGVMCDPGGIKTSRTIHPLLASAEALHTQLGLWGVAQPAIAKEVMLAYENILLYGEHTWGCAPSVNQYGEAFQKLNPKSYATLEASWEDKTDYIRTAAKITGAIAEADLQSLAQSVKAPAGSVIFYNPLPWSRSGVVSIEAKGEIYPLTDMVAGTQVSGDFKDGKFVFLAKDIPPCGYKTYARPAASKWEPSPMTGATILENAFFKLAFDPAKGAIASLVDKRTGREWVDAAAGRGLGQYLNERFTFEQTAKYCLDYQQGRWGNHLHGGMHKTGMISEKQVPYRAAASAKGTVKIAGDTATIDCPADPANHMPATTLRVSLPKDQTYIELELTINDKAKDNWPEADWFCLPFKVANPQFRVYRQLGSMNPATDIITGANRDLFSVGHGVTISDADGAGIAISPLDHPLVSLDRPGCWQFSKDAETFTPKQPVVYLNLYNNQWNTNFRYWYPGTWSSRVRLSTFDAKTPVDAIIATPALEARNPLLAVGADGKGDKLPASQTGIAVSRKGTIVTAFGQNPDGKGTILRVWEQAGVSGELTITLPLGPPSARSGFASATPVNLRGEQSGNPVKIANGKLVFDLKAYAPASFVLE